MKGGRGMRTLGDFHSHSCSQDMLVAMLVLAVKRQVP